MYMSFYFIHRYKTAIFTARRVCIAWTIAWQDVCLSVTRRYSVKPVIDILKLFALSGSQTILVFPYLTRWQYSDWDPLTGALNAKAV